MAFSDRLINFSAGPCQLPLEVLEDVHRQIVDFKGCGISVMEMSHRGPHFKQVLSEAAAAAKNFFQIPSSHELLFMSGGATAQFAAEALNLLKDEKSEADYAITGYWSKYALTEAQRFAAAREVTNSAKMNFNEIAPVEKWDMNPKATYVHYCDNETIHGLEFPSPPLIKSDFENKLIVADMASNLGTREVAWKNVDLAYAGAQKNIGIAGVTLVILNKAIVAPEPARCPSVLSYNKTLNASSCLNTPPCLNIFITKLTLDHLKRKGDLAHWNRVCTTKSDAVYRHCDGSGGFFEAPVKHAFRSRVTVRFAIKENQNKVEREYNDNIKRREENGSGGRAYTPQRDAHHDERGVYTPEHAKEQKQKMEEAKQKDKELEMKFLQMAEKHNMICLNGHRSLGGLRASLFSGVMTEHVERLLHVMREFQEEYEVV